MKFLKFRFEEVGSRRAGMYRSPLVGLVGVVLCVPFLCSAAVPLQGADTMSGQKTLEGELIFVPGTGPALRTPGKDYPLAGRNQYVFRTLQDKRLRNDKVRLVGKMRPDGNFQVNELYTVHHGKLYRIRYYCEICNIVALAPGRCVCCQQPTELQEVPVDQHGGKALIIH